MNRARPGRILVAVLVFAVTAATPAAAQYFGRNKVQYRSFDFEVLKTEHFDVYYYPEEKEAAEMAARMAERWYERLAKVLDHELSGRQPLILYASHPHFEQTNAIPGEIGEATGGVTEAFKRRIVLPLAGPLAETDHVIGHELVHAFQFDITRTSGLGGMSGAGALRMPLWFIEGMAEYLSVGPVDPHTAMWIRDAAHADDLPDIDDLANPRYFPYRYGQALWTYIAGRWGNEVVGRMLRASARAPSTDQLIRSVLEIGPDTLATEWHAAVRAWYEPQVAATEPPSRIARPLVEGKGFAGRLNVAPAISPDGSRFIFLSERDLFSIEMFLGDVETGEIRKKITKTAVDPHFQSLQFLASSGAWSPDGRRFAFGAVSKGRPVLAVLDVDSGERVQELVFEELGEIFNPTWAPDGRRVAFTGLAGGLMDLYVADLSDGSLRRLTTDAHAELQPAWSQDGRRLAFVTDRFGNDLEELSYGHYRLALYDLDSGAITAVPGFDDAKHINPQWSGDGGSLYFISDRRGISNVHRVELESGRLFQVTNVLEGISGITRLSPALTVARDEKRVIFSAYEKGSYNLYTLEFNRPLAGEEPRPEIAGVDPGRLPVRETAAANTAALAATLPMRDAFTLRDYHPRLSLDGIFQPNLAVGFGSGGFGVGGGAALLWSDMLGDHNLLTMFQANGTGGSFFKNLGALVGYENRKSRWNWSVIGAQIPQVTRSFVSDEGTFNGRPAFRDRSFRFWEIDRELQAGVAYPFNRVHRVEFFGGFRNIDFSAEEQTEIFDAITGELVLDETVPLDSPSSINVGTAGTALVYDSSIFGGTSPVLGQRYRLQVAGVAGNLTFFNPLVDYRRYVPLVGHISLAGRALHTGRYGADSEDSRLSDYFIGYPSLVRGYNDGSFSADECVPDPANPDGCPVFDQLLGSRIAVGNVELRIPLLGALGLLRSPGLPPLETALFYDAGVAWTRNQEASFLDGPREPVTSYGAALRINLLGFAVAEIDYVHPNDRPAKGWYWLFSLTPGF